MLVSFFARHPCAQVSFTTVFYIAAPFFSLQVALIIIGLTTILRWRLAPLIRYRVECATAISTARGILEDATG